ncbi:MAG TPA: flagellar basal body P-ring formation chaperone FlgA [Steroidobacteraceae bacterium]|nr:flagellar basal body P-ring formation chaperone FlgA [Steroidobacteraceae bacterium]
MTRIRHPRRRIASTPATLSAVACTVLAAATAGGQAHAQERIEPLGAIRATAVSFIRSQLPPDSGVTQITAGELDNRLRLARCATAPRVDSPAASSASLARSTVGVSCAGPVRWTVYVPVTVVRRVPVLVLRHAVAREAHVTAQDVTIEKRTVTGLTAAFLGSPTELAGRRLERTLPAGTSLTVDMFEPDLVVRRGQDVMLVVAVDGIEVRAAGRALEDATTGSRLKVVNVSSQKVIEGVAESSDIVRVAD